MMRLIYAVCSKNLRNKAFLEILSANDWKIIMCKKAKEIWKNLLGQNTDA